MASSLLVIGGLTWLSGTTRPGSLGEVERRGAAVYQANCAACHGVAGEGQPNWRTPRPDRTMPAPPHDATGHTWHHPDALLFGIVKEGGAYAAPPGFPATMPAYRETLTDQQIVEVLMYIRTLWGPRERASQAAVSEGNPFPIGPR